MCSIYFSAHCDCKRDERTFAGFAGASVYTAQKSLTMLKLARGIAKMPYYIGVLIAKSVLHDLSSPYCTNCILTKWSVITKTVT